MNKDFSSGSYNKYSILHEAVFKSQQTRLRLVVDDCADVRYF